MVVDAAQSPETAEDQHELLLKPRKIFKDPFRGGDHLLVSKAPVTYRLLRLIGNDVVSGSVVARPLPFAHGSAQIQQSMTCPFAVSSSLQVLCDAFMCVPQASAPIQPCVRCHLLVTDSLSRRRTPVPAPSPHHRTSATAMLACCPQSSDNNRLQPLARTPVLQPFAVLSKTPSPPPPMPAHATPQPPAEADAPPSTVLLPSQSNTRVACESVLAMAAPSEPLLAAEQEYSVTHPACPTKVPMCPSRPRPTSSSTSRVGSSRTGSRATSHKSSGAGAANKGGAAHAKSGNKYNSGGRCSSSTGTKPVGGRVAKRGGAIPVPSPHAFVIPPQQQSGGSIVPPAALCRAVWSLETRAPFPNPSLHPSIRMRCPFCLAPPSIPLCLYSLCRFRPHLPS